MPGGGVGAPPGLLVDTMVVFPWGRGRKCLEFLGHLTPQSQEYVGMEMGPMLLFKSQKGRLGQVLEEG